MIRRLTQSIAFAVVVAFSGTASFGDCIADPPDDAFLKIVKKAMETDPDETRRRFLIAGMVTRLMNAGRDRQAVAFAIHERGLGVTPATASADAPAESIAAIRALRFAAAGFSEDTDLSESASDRASWRLQCLYQANNIANGVIGALKDVIRDMALDDPKEASLSVETTLSLLSRLHLERAEVKRDIGDHIFRTINIGEKETPKDPAARMEGSAQLALAHYRDAQFALATAMVAAGDDQIARIRLIALELNDRAEWLRKGQAFGGRNYAAPTRPIGFDIDKDALGFTILHDLDSSLAALDRATAGYGHYLERSNDTLIQDLTRFAKFYGEAESYRQARLQTLFLELDRLDITEGDLALDLSRIVEAQGRFLTDIDARNEAEQKEYAERRKAAARQVLDTLPSLAAKLTALGQLGPLTPPLVKIYPVPKDDPLWREDATLFSRVYGTCGQPLTPEDRSALSVSWKAARTEGNAEDTPWMGPDLENLVSVFTEALKTTLGPAGLAEAKTQFMKEFMRLDNAMETLTQGVFTAQSEDAKLEQRWGELMSECWELGAQLNIERALLLNSRIDLRQEHLDKLYELVEREEGALAEELYAEIRDGGEEAKAALLDNLYKTQHVVVAAAKKQIEQKIAHTERLIGEAQKIVEQVIATGQNVERATQAAESVYAAMTAVPVGTGPGGVFFERETLVALNESAVNLARFTYRATNDVFEIKQQLASFEGKLRAYKEDLERLSLKTSVDDVKRALEQRALETQEDLQAIMKETRDAMLGRVEERRERLEEGAEEILAGAVTLSDSRVALIKRQLEAVFAKLGELAERRKKLREQQVFALHDLQIDMAQTVALAQAVAKVHADYESLLKRQAETLKHTRDRQTDVMDKLRTKDSTIAQRVEELLQQIERLRNGEDENPWSGARDLAVRFLAPPPQLNGNALARALQMRRALDEAGDNLFELAVALKYLTQSDAPLLLAVQPTNLEEAKRLQKALKDLYTLHIRNNIQPRVDVIALRVTPEAAQQWGMVTGEDGPEFPRCLNQEGSEARCLRIVTTYGPRWHWNGLEENEAPLPAVSPRCPDRVSLPRILQPDFPALTFSRDAWVLGPANAKVTAATWTEYCPENDPPSPKDLQTSSMNGELVFMLNGLLGDGNEGILVDAVVATSDPSALDDLLPVDMTPVGTTTAVCKSGDRIDQRLIQRPFQTLYGVSGGWRPSANAFSPGDGNDILKEANERFSGINAIEEFFGIGAAGRRALFFGRGLSNTFDLRLSQDAGLQHEVYVFLFVAYIQCDGRSYRNAVTPAASPYRSDLDVVLTSATLAQAPLARSLINLESQIPAAATSRAKRLNSLQALLSVGAALDAAEPTNSLDIKAIDTLTNELDKYLDAIPKTPDRPQPKSLDALFLCALEGQFDCPLEVVGGKDGEIFPFDAAPVDRPIPLHRFEDVVRLAMSPDTNINRAPLPHEVKTRMTELDETLELLRSALAFLDRSVTTERAVVRLEALAERRLDMVEDATEMLRVVQPGIPTGLTEAACVNHFYSDPAFWQLNASKGSFAQSNHSLGLVSGFLAHCVNAEIPENNPKCVDLANSVASGKPAGATNPIDVTCARQLGLGEDVVTFARALAQIRLIYHAPESGEE